MRHQLHIHDYGRKHREACIQILESNTPEFFSPKDRQDFASFLDNLPGRYFIAEDGGSIVACGGWAMNDEHVAALTWGMVRCDFHRQGIGRQFLQYRLNAIREDGRAQVVQIHTVQLVQAFFAREGFAVVDVIPNGYGIGLDEVIMRLQVK